MSRDLLDRRLKLKLSSEVFPASDGSIYLLRSGTDDDYVIENADDSARLLLGLLDGTQAVRAIAEAVSERGEWSPDAVRDAVAALLDLGFLENADAPERSRLSSSDLDRFDRQIDYLSEIASPDGDPHASQAKLRRSRVSILGLGGIGTWVAYGLACVGLGRLDLVDGDTVELSNLNRQILYAPADIGRPKAAVAGERITAYDQDLDVRTSTRRLESSEQIEQVIAGADFVVEALDWPPHTIGHWVNRACLAEGTPHISAGLVAPIARAGPTFIPGITGCMLCQEQVLRSETPLFDELMRFRREQATQAPTVAAGCAWIASVITADVLHYLTGSCEPSTLGRAITVDLRTMQSSYESFERSPECAACGSSSPAGERVRGAVVEPDIAA